MSQQRARLAGGRTFSALAWSNSRVWNACVHDGRQPISNYAFNPIAEQALRPNHTIVPQRVNAALGVDGEDSVFTAQSVVLEDPEGQTHFLGLADDAQVPVTYLIISKAKQYDEQDHAFGMATYHVEFCGEEMAGYGGIREVELSKDRIDLNFDEIGMHFMNGLKGLSIGFSADQVDFELLKRVLSEIFGETSCAFRVAA